VRGEHTMRVALERPIVPDDLWLWRDGTSVVSRGQI